MVKFLLFISTLVFSMHSYSVESVRHEFTIGINERDIFRFKDENGAWAGKDIALIKAVFRRTPYTYKIVSVPWARVVKGIKLGVIDMTLAATVLPEREKYARFSKEPFRYSHHMLFVHRDKLDLFKHVTSLHDLINTNILIGVLRGGVYSDSYNQLLQNEDFVKRLAYIGNDQDMPEFVLKGRVDAYIESEIEGKHYLLKQANYSENIVPFFRIASNVEAEGKIMFSKKTVTQAQIEVFDLALKQLHESGEYEEISKKFEPK